MDPTKHHFWRWPFYAFLSLFKCFVTNPLTGDIFVRPHSFKTGCILMHFELEKNMHVLWVEESAFSTFVGEMASGA